MKTTTIHNIAPARSYDSFIDDHWMDITRRAEAIIARLLDETRDLPAYNKLAICVTTYGRSGASSRIYCVFKDEAAAEAHRQFIEEYSEYVSTDALIEEANVRQDGSRFVVPRLPVFDLVQTFGSNVQITVTRLTKDRFSIDVEPYPAE